MVGMKRTTERRVASKEKNERNIIGISMGTFSTFVAGSTREGEHKTAIGDDGELFLRTHLDLEIDSNGSDYQSNGTGSSLAVVRLDQLDPGTSVIPDVDATQVIGRFLRQTRDLALRQISDSTNSCVISVPSDSSAEKIKMIVDSANKAGFDHVYPLKECIAIILGPSICDTIVNLDDDNPNDKLLCTINVGCYNTEYSIIRVRQASLKVLACKRFSIGGGDVTLKIYDEVKRQFCSINRVCQTKLNNKTQNKLLQACESSKRSLIIKGSASVLCESLHEGIDCNVPISLQKIEACCDDIFRNSVNNINKFFSDNGINPDAITHVILAGGAMRMQRLQDVYKNLFSKSEILTSPEPEQAVVQGCRLHGYKLRSVCPESSGFKVAGTNLEIYTLKSSLNLLPYDNEVIELFPEGSIIPSSRTLHLGLKPNQKSIYLAIGGKSPLAEFVLNTSSLKDNSSHAHLLVVLETESLIRASITSDGVIVDSVNLDFSSLHSPHPVTASG